MLTNADSQGSGFRLLCSPLCLVKCVDDRMTFISMNNLLLILSCTIAVIADMLFVWWGKRSDHPIWSLITAFILNAIGCGIWTYTLKKGIESATAITFYALFTVAGCSLLGILYFKECLSAANWAGVGLGVISLILLSI